MEDYYSRSSSDKAKDMQYNKIQKCIEHGSCVGLCANVPKLLKNEQPNLVSKYLRQKIKKKYSDVDVKTMPSSIKAFEKLFKKLNFKSRIEFLKDTGFLYYFHPYSFERVDKKRKISEL